MEEVANAAQFIHEWCDYHLYAFLLDLVVSPCRHRVAFSWFFCYAGEIFDEHVNYVSDCIVLVIIIIKKNKVKWRLGGMDKWLGFVYDYIYTYQENTDPFGPFTRQHLQEILSVFR